MQTETETETLMAETATAVTLAVLNERLEAIEDKLDLFHNDHQHKQADIELRVRTVERWMYTVPASLLTALAAATYTIAQNT
jgi:hypothetical protein